MVVARSVWIEAVLGAPAEPGHPRAGERLDQPLGKRKAHVGPVERDAFDPRAVEPARQPAHGGLDFGQLGHRRALRQPRPL